MTETARFWRNRHERYQLRGEICPHCDEKIFPPRDVCPSCKEEAKETVKLSGKGEIQSWTTVYDAPAGHEDQAPYVVALIKLDEGPMVTAQLTDLGDEKPGFGMPVEMVTRVLKKDGDRGQIIYGYKFRPQAQLQKQAA